MQNNCGSTSHYVRRIEICGGIGAGKSTVAAALAQVCSLRFIRESYEDVPFWDKYYQNPSEYEFEKNISFLLSYGDAIREGLSHPHDGNPAILDFALFQVLAYADLSDSKDDAMAIEGVYDRLIARFGAPDVLLHVHCPVDLQLERIRKRGRAQEAGIGEAYLLDLSHRIDDRVDRLKATLPVIEIDTSAIDFGNRSDGAVCHVERRLQCHMALFGNAT